MSDDSENPMSDDSENPPAGSVQGPSSPASSFVYEPVAAPTQFLASYAPGAGNIYASWLPVPYPHATYALAVYETSRGSLVASVDQVQEFLGLVYVWTGVSLALGTAYQLKLTATVQGVTSPAAVLSLTPVDLTPVTVNGVLTDTTGVLVYFTPMTSPPTGTTYAAAITFSDGAAMCNASGPSVPVLVNASSTTPFSWGTSYTLTLTATIPQSSSTAGILGPATTYQFNCGDIYVLLNVSNDAGYQPACPPPGCIYWGSGYTVGDFYGVVSTHVSSQWFFGFEYVSFPPATLRPVQGICTVSHDAIASWGAAPWVTWGTNMAWQPGDQPTSQTVSNSVYSYIATQVTLGAAPSTGNLTNAGTFQSYHPPNTVDEPFADDD